MSASAARSAIVRAQPVDQRQRALLPAAACAARRGKAVVLRQAFAPVVLLGQEQIGERGPACGIVAAGQATRAAAAPRLRAANSWRARAVRRAPPPAAARARAIERRARARRAARLRARRARSRITWRSQWSRRRSISTSSSSTRATLLSRCTSSRATCPRDRVLRFDQLDRRARRLGIERARVLDALGLRAESGQHRHLPRQRRAQRIDGLDAQPRRVVGDAPAARAVARERRARELERALARAPTLPPCARRRVAPAPAARARAFPPRPCA